MCWASITEKSLGRSMLPSSHAHDHSTFSASSCCWTSPLVYEAAMTLRKSNAFSICRYLGEMSSMTRRRKNAYASAPVSQVLRWYHRGRPQGYLRGLHQVEDIEACPKKSFRGFFIPSLSPSPGFQALAGSAAASAAARSFRRPSRREGPFSRALGAPTGPAAAARQLLSRALGFPPLAAQQAPT